MNRTGFSLLELMLVLVVLVGVLALVWPNLQRPLKRSNLSNAAQKLREAIDESRHKAVVDGNPVFVQLQQGTSEVQTGTFSSFLESDDSGMKTSLEENSNSRGSSTTSLTSNLSDDHTDTPKSWRLPEDVVIVDVRWSAEEENDEEESGLYGSESFDSANPGDPSNDREHSKNTSREKLVSSSFSAHESESHDEVSKEHCWWLPLTCQGQGRDASIILLDTKIGEELTVIYSSATGSLEIVR